MAIHEQPRENLLRDASQFPRRAVFSSKEPEHGQRKLAETVDEVFIGIRADGGWSFYWDQDYVIQLDTERRLRRVFWQGRKLAARGGKLQELSRHAKGGRIQFERSSLADCQQNQLLDEIRHLLAQFICRVRDGALRGFGQQPDVDEDPPATG